MIDPLNEVPFDLTASGAVYSVICSAYIQWDVVTPSLTSFHKGRTSSHSNQAADYLFFS